uniref:Ovule protein n=2 Tax=Caenorhabditis tropicalis TaxID=1561998 RepID=A0A1I7UZZ5_9PELO
MSARKIVSHLLKITRGILFVKEFMWTICRPKEWKKVMESPSEVNEDRINLTGKGVTVDELTEIFTNFLTQNSSMSQSSIFTDSTQPFSSFSSLSLARSRSFSSCSSPKSCDSSVTITPFSFYPAQQSAGFINLPPPYHTLPDTAFFRRAKIVPPPPIKPKIVSLQQNIMNCYIQSIQKGDSELTRRRQISVCSNMELECNWCNTL